MPVISIPIDELKKRINKNINKDELLEILAQNGSDIEDILFLQRYKCSSCNFIIEKIETEGKPSVCDNCFISFTDNPDIIFDMEPIEVIRMELLAVRPDLFEVAGLSRALRGYLDMEVGPRNYHFSDSDHSVHVDSSLYDKKSFRPEIACAIIKNIRFDDYFIKSIMKLQENLHWAMGRNRKLASIGVYDLDSIQFPLYYSTADKESFSFKPLPYAGYNNEPMILKDILRDHPKGKAYAYLLDDFDRFPILKDSKDQVLSMPPIINSIETMVKMETRNIFIDVTGPYRDKVNQTLNTFICALLEMQDDLQPYRIKIINKENVLTPETKRDEMTVRLDDCNKLIGFSLSIEDFDKLLQKARYETKVINKMEISVKVPMYRSDIMHPNDIYEDVAIMYGYHNLNPHRISSITEGREHIIEKYSNYIREIFTGMSFIEINTLYLTNRNIAFNNMKLKTDDNTPIIENPASMEQEIVRSSIMPGLLEVLSFNKHNPLPQKIYEIGDVSLLCDRSETRSQDERRISALIIDSKTGFSDIRGVLQTLFQGAGKKLHIKPNKYPFYIEGRAGDIYYEDDGNMIKIGHIGEIHPEVILNFKLSNPVAGFEINLMKWIEKEKDHA